MKHLLPAARAQSLALPSDTVHVSEFGTLNTCQTIEKQNPGLSNRFVMGPWVHGGWSGGTGEMVGNVAYGPSPSLWYQENMEAPFF